jgi:hypothetical protein
MDRWVAVDLQDVGNQLINLLRRERADVPVQLARVSGGEDVRAASPADPSCR